MIRRFTASSAAVLALSLASPALAQAPSAGYVFPSGAQIGAKTNVTVNGGNLQEASATVISGEGVAVKIVKNTEAGSLGLELEAAGDAVPGAREIRIITPRGTSNAARIWVGPYAEANETEPNNTYAAPQKMERLPATFNGQINGGEDVDVYAFSAGAGETMVFDLVAIPLASPLDGYLQLADSRGKVITSSQEPFDRDPRIIHTFQTAGAYTILVRDTLYRGDANFVYRLTAGQIPLVTGYLPLAGRRGQSTEVLLEGVNLGSMKTLQIQMPESGDAHAVAARTSSGTALHPVSLAATQLEEYREYEPNNLISHATPLGDLPVAASGRIDKPGDVDLFKITPTTAGLVTFNLFARRLGSRIDPYLRILDAMGKELQSNDDADGKDSRVSFNVQAGTVYLLEVRSQEKSSGVNAYYRLEMAPPSGQDFKLSLLPAGVNVAKAGSAMLTVNLQRINGFGGPVQVRVEGLPAGVTASPVTIPAGQASALFTLSADGSANPGAMSMMRVIGTGQIGDQMVERSAIPIEQYTLPQAPDGQVSRREAKFLPAAVMPQQAYSLATESRQVTIKRGMNATIKIIAARQAGATQAINITVAGQPNNVNPMLQNIAANANEVTLTLQVAGNAPVGTYNLVFTGNMNNNVQVAPALAFTITE